jgi:hypothetical protein
MLPSVFSTASGWRKQVPGKNIKFGWQPEGPIYLPDGYHGGAILKQCTLFASANIAGD